VGNSHHYRSLSYHTNINTSSAQRAGKKNLYMHAYYRSLPKRVLTKVL
jgi:hypothetical protein